MWLKQRQTKFEKRCGREEKSREVGSQKGPVSEDPLPGKELGRLDAAILRFWGGTDTISREWYRKRRARLEELHFTISQGLLGVRRKKRGGKHPKCERLSAKKYLLHFRLKPKEKTKEKEKRNRDDC